MDKKQVMERYILWKSKVSGDRKATLELEEMAEDEKKIEDAFYRNLAFGTGGLRGVLGMGTNRMNRYTVAKASQGLADYLKKHFCGKPCKAAVSYDSRICSEEFAKVTAGVLAANGIGVCLYRDLMPTPCLSYAVRKLGCEAGVMITASHNPAKYNGYKVYGDDGCQITTETAAAILKEIEKLDLFEDVEEISFDEGMGSGMISYISDEVIDSYLAEVKGQSVIGAECQKFDKSVSVVYSPLNGTGLYPVTRVLSECGFEDIFVVPEQEKPDGNFPTCPYPNPEIDEAMELAVRYAGDRGAELAIATDPDCDRVGIAVRNGEDYVLLSGNETGLLLLDFVCARKKESGLLSEDPVFVKTIVTTGLAEVIAASYGVRTVNVLTGFKFIGEYIGMLEQENREGDYVFGFEESCGYLSGGYVRDKDGVNAALLICEMAAFYKAAGKSLYERLEELYRTYGYCLDTLHSYQFEGADGAARMKEIMRQLRERKSPLEGERILQSLDYIRGLDGLPPSDVLQWKLDDGCCVVLRPSGTEPKLKLYISVTAENSKMAEEREKRLTDKIEKMLYH